VRVLADRERVPDHEAVVVEHRNLARRIDGEDLGLRDASDLEAAAAAADAWSSWWTENAEALTWNAELGRFEGGSA